MSNRAAAGRGFGGGGGFGRNGSGDSSGNIRPNDDRGFGRSNGGGGRNRPNDDRSFRRGGRGSGGGASAGFSSRLNSTGDGELSTATRSAMRDDSIIIAQVMQHIPPNGAISIKSLFSTLDDDLQEAIAETHGGLRCFLESRQQLFIVREQPNTGVFFVAANPIAVQKYATREMQRKAMRQMMGLDNPQARGSGGRRPSGGQGYRGDGRPPSGDRMRPPPYRGNGPASDGPSAGRNGRSFGASDRGSNGDGIVSPRRGGPMDTRGQSFGGRR